MAPLTDRQRVELALPARMLLRCMNTVYAQHTSPDDKEKTGKTISRLDAACREALAGSLERDKLVRRIERANAVALDPIANKPLMLAILTTGLWLKKLLDQNYLVLTAGSSFDQASGNVFASIADHQDLFAEFLDDARAESARMHARLQAFGYYAGATI